MVINEKGTNMQITPDIKDYLYKKLAHLEKFINPTDGSALCDVELGKVSNHHKNGDVFRTEINLHISGRNLRAVSEQSELFASIDVAKDEMVHALQSNKDKKLSLLKRGGAQIKNLLKGFMSNDQE